MMNTMDVDPILVDGYLHLLRNLSLSQKLDLITKLTASAKEDLSPKTSAFKQAFGAFETEKPVEEMIQEIRSSRTFTREIEAF